MAELTNAQIAAAFDELGDLYELDGAVQYRVIAYRTAARTVRDSSTSVMDLVRQGRVTELPGIGRTLEEKLVALDQTGDIPAAAKLRAKFPPGLLSVMHLPGFGPKRARRLYEELGVDSLDALRAAAERGDIRKLRGLGARAATGAGGALRGRRRRARDHALRPEGRPQGRRAGPVRQRPAALHGLAGPQRGAARGGRAAWAARLRVRNPRRLDRR